MSEFRYNKLNIVLAHSAHESTNPSIICEINAYKKPQWTYNILISIVWNNKVQAERSSLCDVVRITMTNGIASSGVDE